MTTYRYKGQTKDGTAVSGVIRAYDEFEAASRLRETVAIITRLEEVREKKESIFNRPIGLKIKEKELALICSQFAIILSAGMSIQHCVEMVAAQARSPGVCAGQNHTVGSASASAAPNWLLVAVAMGGMPMSLRRA